MRLFHTTTESKVRCSGYVPPTPASAVAEQAKEPDLANMDPEDYDQSDFFSSSRDYNHSTTRPCVNNLLWVNIHDMIAKIPDMRSHLKTWLTEGEVLEIGDPSQREDIAFHDPQDHGQFFKRTHVLPQDNWIPASSHPSPEELQDAVNELSLYSEQAQAKAVVNTPFNRYVQDAGRGLPTVAPSVREACATTVGMRNFLILTMME